MSPVYLPEGLPWTAKRKGTDRLVWYVIFNTHGDEVCNTGSVTNDEESRVRAEVLLLLSRVNGSDVVSIDGEERRIVWK